MGRAFRAVREADDPFEQLEPLETMRIQAEKMLEMVPHDADAEDTEAFREGIRKLLRYINAAWQAADEEDTETVAAAVRELRALRKEYHERFDVDDD